MAGPLLLSWDNWHGMALALWLISCILQTSSAGPHVSIPNSRNCTQTVQKSAGGRVWQYERLSKHTGTTVTIHDFFYKSRGKRSQREHIAHTKTMAQQEPLRHTLQLLLYLMQSLKWWEHIIPKNLWLIIKSRESYSLQRQNSALQSMTAC